MWKRVKYGMETDMSWVQADFDVFNALDLMENSQFVQDLKFGPGDGLLNFYLYNWQVPDVSKNKVGLVML